MTEPQDRPRLIEVAFPLKQTSIDSVHEKNVRHGHISTLHIWPARRPLAACRAALIATLLPDPGTPEARRELCERIGGKLVKNTKKKKLPNGRVEDRVVDETVGGILHWGRETENEEGMQWFRDEIKKAYGGRAPRVLDPFAGGGAIPLEAMRLGCEVTANDINPVAWFILKCTLEYPQKLARKKLPLPDFALCDRDFMTEFFESQGLKKTQIRTFLRDLGLDEAKEQQKLLTGPGFDPAFLDADLAWHVRAWGRHVLDAARKELADRYPVYADFMKTAEGGKHVSSRPMQRVPVDAQGKSDLAALNREFEGRSSLNHQDKLWLGDPTAPRWVAKPTVAYLWARTVRCKQCRAEIPLLKTLWLAKKDKKRVLLRMEPNADKSGVVFAVESGVGVVGANHAARREHDKRIGRGTMSRAGAWCPCCGKPGTVSMETESIRHEGLAGRLASRMTAVVVEGDAGKEFRLPTVEETAAASLSKQELEGYFADVPGGIPSESLPDKEALGIRVPLYGLRDWQSLFLGRQLAALGVLTRAIRSCSELVGAGSTTPVWRRAISHYLCVALGRAANYLSTLCLWDSTAGEVKQTFLRFALPITWDFAEANPFSPADRYFAGGISKIGLVLDGMLNVHASCDVTVKKGSAIALTETAFDVIVTDPPYYDAIPYSDLMDFFYVWLRRAINEKGDVGETLLAPKWDHESNDGELIDDASRFGGDAQKSLFAYEDGMKRAFIACKKALVPNGRFVVVFANKQPKAWETLVKAVIDAGFVVCGSLPIMTEMRGGVRNLARASLASSVWLVCKCRPDAARPGWDTSVLAEMRTRIRDQLRTFWDAGIRGPDFVWAATGPAMEAYSRHPIIKKADAPGELMTVSEFLRAVRRIVVDFVVGRVLSEATHKEAGDEFGGGLDDVTTYYLLHRHDFGMEDAPAGACILYAVSCNLSEGELADRYDVLLRSGRAGADEPEEEESEGGDAEGDVEQGTGSTFRLKAWKQRTRPGMGLEDGAERSRARTNDPSVAAEAPAPARAIPLVDQVHRLMLLWKAGDQARVDQYLDARGLRKSAIFPALLQALIELATEGSEERAILESVMNHIGARGMTAAAAPTLPFVDLQVKDEEENER
ncbi:MAG: DUF1156 domain-containing protein [Planctomycetes bacterium]|nr:DUF1156 domain-containing protein [Planctomycetota bacterium]